MADDVFLTGARGSWAGTCFDSLLESGTRCGAGASSPSRLRHRPGLTVVSGTCATAGAGASIRAAGCSCTSARVFLRRRGTGGAGAGSTWPYAQPARRRRGSPGGEGGSDLELRRRGAAARWQARPENDWAEVHAGPGYHSSKVRQERAALRANLRW